jgi:hypothetical protein
MERHETIAKAKRQEAELNRSGVELIHLFGSGAPWVRENSGLTPAFAGSC